MLPWKFENTTQFNSTPNPGSTARAWGAWLHVSIAELSLQSINQVVPVVGQFVLDQGDVGL